VSSSVERRVRVLVVGCCWRAEEEHKHKQSRDGRAARVYDRSFVDLWGAGGDGPSKRGWYPKWR
jgi:hypothetical protein